MHRDAAISRRGFIGQVGAALLTVASVGLAGCKDQEPKADTEALETHARPSFDDIPAEANTDKGKDDEEPSMKLSIDDTEVEVAWEKNESVDALAKLVDGTPLTVQMSPYGGFEQVGSLGTTLPASDVQTTTQAGDIVLYAGNQIVVFYGSNSWAYTKLGHITDRDASQMAELLGNGAVSVTIS